MEHVATLGGHAGAVLSVDVCAEQQLVAAGSADGTASVWDWASGQLVRRVGGYGGPVVSVSVNRISGHVCTLAPRRLRVLDVNGQIVHDVQLTPCGGGVKGEGGVGGDEGERGAVGGGSDLLLLGRVVLAPPSGDWQRGVVAVTGHVGGQVFLWRSQQRKDASIGAKIGAGEGVEVGGFGVDGAGGGCVGWVPCGPSEEPSLEHVALPLVHRSAITVLRVCGARNKGVVERTFDGVGSAELLVGDQDGVVSRWGVPKG